MILDLEPCDNIEETARKMVEQAIDSGSPYCVRSIFNGVPLFANNGDTPEDIVDFYHQSAELLRINGVKNGRSARLHRRR